MKTIISLLSIDLRKTVNEKKREKQFDRERNWGELEASRALFVQSPLGAVVSGWFRASVSMRQMRFVLSVSGHNATRT